MTDILQTVQHATRKYLAEEINNQLLPFIQLQVADMISKKADQIEAIVKREVESIVNDKVGHKIRSHSIKISEDAEKMIAMSVERQVNKVGKDQIDQLVTNLVNKKLETLKAALK